MAGARVRVRVRISLSLSRLDRSHNTPQRGRSSDDSVALPTRFAMTIVEVRTDWGLRGGVARTELSSRLDHTTHSSEGTPPHCTRTPPIASAMVGTLTRAGQSARRRDLPGDRRARRRRRGHLQGAPPHTSRERGRRGVTVTHVCCQDRSIARPLVFCTTLRSRRRRGRPSVLGRRAPRSTRRPSRRPRTRSASTPTSAPS